MCNQPDYELFNLKVDITEQILKKMVEKKISRCELAKKAGLANRSLKQLFKLNTDFTFKTLRKIADALDLKMEIEFIPSQNKGDG